MDFQGSFTSLTFHEDDESIEFFAGISDGSLEASISLGFEIEEEELDHQGYNRWYLQREGEEFIKPIIFEDGMDYSDCRLYYQAQHSQNLGGMLITSPQASQRLEFLEQVKHTDMNKPRPCLRLKSGEPDQSNQSKERPAVRRYSFSGPTPGRLGTMARTNSAKRIQDQTPRVSFERNVKVVTIHPVTEYPGDIRLGMWMTREELAASARNAKSDEARQERKKQFMNMSKEDLVQAVQCLSTSPSLS